MPSERKAIEITMEQPIQLNEHNKQEYPPIHTTDLNPALNDIIIYQTEDGEIKLDVKMENETVWLTQVQMSELFQTDRTSIVRHINNIYKSHELKIESTCAKIAQVRTEGKRTVTRYIPFYNLDIIISVGYRVNSIRGTQFRIWSNKILKDYLIKGYAINQNIKLEHYQELKDIVRILGNTLNNQERLTSDQSRGLLAVVNDYVYALDTLDKYDYQLLFIESTTKGEKFHATYESAMEAIQSLKEKFGESELFAHEKDQSFRSSISTIYQTFDGIELYPSIEEKAAMLLYLVTKNHSFNDGNKRIAAMLFLWFMENNGILYRPNGKKRIADNTLVALTLMIAESRIEEKDIMVKVVVNLINQNN
jgi:prophage maintenance system killer protein